jgi:hypothetical protein
MKNLVNDIKFVKMEYPCEGCAVHRGFLETYHDISGGMLEYA